MSIAQRNYNEFNRFNTTLCDLQKKEVELNIKVKFNNIEAMQTHE